jgi:hypothetical protein
MAAPDFIRTHKGWLQTAFLSLRNDEREIAILVTVDVAPEDYFQRITDQIKRREKRGFAIVYDDGAGADKPGAIQRAMLDALREHGLVYLWHSILTEDYWINAGQVVEAAESDLRADEASEGEIGDDVAANAEALAASLRSGDLPHPIHDLARKLTSEVVEKRNAHIVEVIQQQAKHYHVYAFLPASRVGGIVEKLTAEGFALRDTHWMDVMAVEQGRVETKPTIDHRRQ